MSMTVNDLACVVVVDPVQDFVPSEILDLLVDELIEFPSPGPQLEDAEFVASCWHTCKFKYNTAS